MDIINVKIENSNYLLFSMLSKIFQTHSDARQMSRKSINQIEQTASQRDMLEAYERGLKDGINAGRRQLLQEQEQVRQEQKRQEQARQEEACQEQIRKQACETQARKEQEARQSRAYAEEARQKQDNKEQTRREEARRFRAISMRSLQDIQSENALVKAARDAKIAREADESNGQMVCTYCMSCRDAILCLPAEINNPNKVCNACKLASQRLQRALNFERSG